MKIIVVGTGYVGLVHAAVCSEYGHEVYAHDIDKQKIDAFSSGQADQIEKHVNEPGLVNIIRDTLGKSLFFSHDFKVHYGRDRRDFYVSAHAFQYRRIYQSDVIMMPQPSASQKYLPAEKINAGWFW